MIYEIDLSGVQTPAEFHQRVRAVLPVPAWYGNNLDALEDVLTESGGGWTVRFLHLESLRAASPQYAAALERLCGQAQQEIPELRMELFK